MAKLTVVKKAQASKHTRRCKTCNHDIQAGESYTWRGIMVGSRGVKEFWCSNHPPTRRDLERSEFQQALIGMEDERDTAVKSFRESTEPDASDLASTIRDIAEQLSFLADETEEKYENMPDGLKEGDTGQLLEARAEACREKIDEFNGVADDLEGEELEPLDLGAWEGYAKDKDVTREEDETDEEYRDRIQEEMEQEREDKIEEIAGKAEDLDFAIE